MSTIVDFASPGEQVDSPKEKEKEERMYGERGEFKAKGAFPT